MNDVIKYKDIQNRLSSPAMFILFLLIKFEVHVRFGNAAYCIKFGNAAIRERLALFVFFK